MEPVHWLLIGCIAVCAWLALPSGTVSYINSLLNMKANDVIPPVPKVATAEQKTLDASARYLSVQNLLLEARKQCTDSPEATEAINLAMKATVALVVGAK